MKIPSHVIANADDLGLNKSVNAAILYCYINGYVNSTSLLTNTIYFDDTVQLINENPIINNIGVHIDFAEGKPLSNFSNPIYLNEQGCWNIFKTSKVFNHLNKAEKQAFTNELYAQIDKALIAKINITHLDAHFHLHTLPCFYPLFLHASKKYHLKLRLAQTYNEGNYLKFMYRKYVNYQIKAKAINYAQRFETVDRYLSSTHNTNAAGITEVMLHPDFDKDGVLTDHYDAATIKKWIAFLNKSKV